MEKMKNYFFVGLITIIPLWLTTIIISFMLKVIGNLSTPLIAPLIESYLGDEYPVVILRLASFAASVFFIIIIGVFSGMFFGKPLLGLMDSIISKIPWISDIFSAFKQLSQFFFIQKKQFSEVVLVPFPKAGAYTIAFLTADHLTLAGCSMDDMASVFVPKTPNPTNGFLILVKRSEIIPIDLTIDEAFKLVVSGGIIFPERFKKCPTEKNGKDQTG
jgi:uncharacterized membrane protein